MKELNATFLSVLKNPQAFGLGLYMANRKLLASAFSVAGVVGSNELIIRNLAWLGGLIAIIVVNRISYWTPTRKWALLAGFSGSLGILLFAYGGDLSYFGSIINGLSSSLLTIYFALVICSVSGKEQVYSLAIAVVVSVAVVCTVKALPSDNLFIPFAAMSILVGFLLAPAKEGSPVDQWNRQKMHLPQAVPLTMLSTISVGYIMCSILNGLATEYFSLSSLSTLIMFAISGLVMLIVLAFIRKAEVFSSESPLFRLWPLFAVLLIFGLISFSSSFFSNESIAYGIAFSGLTLFYFFAWIVCPIIINQYKLPVVFSFGIVQVVTCGFFWRQLGIFLSGFGFSMLSISLFGTVTILFVLICLIVIISKRMQKLTRIAQKKKAEPLGEFAEFRDKFEAIAKERGLTEREFEVVFFTLQGYSASRAAAKLYVSESTVRFHLRNVYKKLGIHSKQDLLDFLTERQIFKLGDLPT